MTDQSLLVRLKQEKLSILVEHNGKELHRSRLPGVYPLLELVDRFPDGLQDTTVADRIVGGCAARIFVYLKVTKVLGLRGSSTAERILETAEVEFLFQETVPEIRNRPNTDTCPFEKLSVRYQNPQDLIQAVRAKLAELCPGKAPVRSNQAAR